MHYLSDKLLNGLNPEQQRAVKATDGRIVNHGRSWKWKNASINPSHCLLNGRKTSESLQYFSDYVHK